MHLPVDLHLGFSVGLARDPAARATIRAVPAVVAAPPGCRSSPVGEDLRCADRLEEGIELASDSPPKATDRLRVNRPPLSRATTTGRANRASVSAAPDDAAKAYPGR